GEEAHRDGLALLRALDPLLPLLAVAGEDDARGKGPPGRLDPLVLRLALRVGGLLRARLVELLRGLMGRHRDDEPEAPRGVSVVDVAELDLEDHLVAVDHRLRAR